VPPKVPSSVSSDMIASVIPNELKVNIVASFG
jgi:hypothetical protein